MGAKHFVCGWGAAAHVSAWHAIAHIAQWSGHCQPFTLFNRHRLIARGTSLRLVPSDSSCPVSSAQTSRPAAIHNNCGEPVHNSRNLRMKPFHSVDTFRVEMSHPPRAVFIHNTAHRFMHNRNPHVDAPSNRYPHDPQRLLQLPTSSNATSDSRQCTASRTDEHDNSHPPCNVGTRNE